VAALAGLFDNLPSDQIVAASAGIREALAVEMPGIQGLVERGDKLADSDREGLINLAQKVVESAWKHSKR
jgi:hypothetical protein